MLAVEQAGQYILFTEIIKFLFEFCAVGGLTANNDLGTGFAVDAGTGKFHFRIESLAVRQQTMGFQRAFLFVIFAVVAQEILELSVIFRCHHIHNRRAFDFVQAVEAEHLEVGTVGENVHAFVYIGDGVARAFHQYACAFFAFVEFFFVIVCALAGFGLRQFTFDNQLQVFRHVVGTQVGGALAHGVNDAGFVAGLTDGDE